ncbi:MAG: hypothetical protein ACYC7E_05710 [Armatimonadota bacterium]
MSTLSLDTSPEAEAVLLAMMRQTPPWRKMELLDALNATAREFALAGLRRRYPAAGEAELRRRLADLLLGPELALKVYGPLVSEETRDGC